MSRSSPGARAGALPLIAAFAFAACQYFPSHEDIYIPVPLRIGDMRIEGADTTYVLQGDGFEIVAFAREVLLEARPELDGAAVAFRRHFGTEPPTVRIHYEALEGRSLRAMRTSRSDTTARPTGERGSRELRVPVVLPAERGDPMRIVSVTGELAREWVLAHAAGDDEAGVGSAGAAAPAYPEWFIAGASDLVARSPRQMLYLAVLQRQIARVPPLEQFVRADPPEHRDAPATPRRTPPGIAAQRATVALLWRAQAVTFTHYLAEREGPEFIGTVGARLLAGEDIFQILRGARTVPDTPEALNDAWRAWIAAAAPPSRM